MPKWAGGGAALSLYFLAFSASTNPYFPGKVRGYPAWPAKVVEQRPGGKYAVIFFGTLETANVNSTDIWPYDTAHTTKFCTNKNLARPLFMEGMEQMKQTLEKEGRKTADPANSSEREDTDMVKVGRSESMKAADESQGSSKGKKRKLTEPEQKVLDYDIHNTFCRESAA